MKPDEDARENPLEQLCREIRDEIVEPEVIESAAERVRRSLGAPEPAGAVDAGRLTVIRGCRDFRALMRERLAVRLTAARALLLEDHLRDCADCRAALRAIRSDRSAPLEEGPAARATGRPAGGPFSGTRALLAAAALFAVAIAGAGVLWVQRAGSGVRPAVIESVQGALHLLSGDAATPLPAGTSLTAGQTVRTARDSSAVVLLADGSRVEMRERSEMSFSGDTEGTIVRLARGGIIVQAAPQGTGRLAVRTEDCLASVKGTVFSVSHGTKGSRVSVIEGAVEVNHGRSSALLRPGEQVSTSAALEAVPLNEEIAWSRDAERYLGMLSELKALGRTMEEAITPRELRHSTRLLDLMPARTVVYASVPNLSTGLAEAHDIFMEGVGRSDALREWWQNAPGAHKAEQSLRSTIGEVRRFGSQLGEEVAIGVLFDDLRGFCGLVALAELRNPDEFAAFLGERVAGLNDSSRHGPTVRIVTDQELGGPADGSGGGCPATEGREGALLLHIHGDVLAAATTLQALRSVDAACAGGGAGGLAGSPFHARLSRSYAEGVAWLVGFDLHEMIPRSSAPAGPDGPLPPGGEGTGEASREEMIRRLGLLDLRHLIAVERPEEDRAVTRTELTFDESRRGVASWLAPPAPMGSLSFVSPEAVLAAGFVVKDPAALLDDLWGILGASHTGFEAHLRAFESRSGVSLREDLAAPLGGDFALAIDGPVLPVPAWKLVVEVYDPARLERTLERLAGEMNDRAKAAGAGEVTHSVEVSGGRSWHRVRLSNPPAEVHYVFVDGFLLAAPSRGLLERAILQRASGATLPASEAFAAALPRGSEGDFSALAWQNLGSAFGPLARGLAPAGPGSGRASGLAALAAGASPSLAYAIADEERILMVSSAESLFGGHLGALLSLEDLSAFGTATSAPAAPSRE